MKKIISLLLCLGMLCSLGTAAYAEGIDSRVVLGADLNEAQIKSVYNMFSINQGHSTELKITNAEEREYLEDYVDSAVIGTRAVSCVYVELLSPGEGMSITTSNINWCTPEMYISALATAGITDARIEVAAPVEVSGTAALIGVYKAYESMTGQKLDDIAKLVSTQELNVTGQLAAQIGAMDSTSIVNELKLILDETAKMTDEELKLQIGRIASEYKVELTEGQIQQLFDLCRALEKLDADALRSRVSDLRETLSKLSEAKDKVAGFAQSVKSFFASVSELIEKLKTVFSKE